MYKTKLMKEYAKRYGDSFHRVDGRWYATVNGKDQLVTVAWLLKVLNGEIEIPRLEGLLAQVDQQELRQAIRRQQRSNSSERAEEEEKRLKDLAAKALAAEEAAKVKLAEQKNPAAPELLVDQPSTAEVQVVETTEPKQKDKKAKKQNG